MANDIGNAIQPADKSGNWWILHASGAMEAGSALTMAPVGYTAPQINPLGFNGSSQIYKSDGAVAYPTSDFSFVTVITLASPVGSTFDLIAKFDGGSNLFFTMELAAGYSRFYVKGTSAFAEADAGGPLAAGSHIIGGRYNATTGAIVLRVDGTNYTATVSGGGVLAGSLAHSFGGNSAPGGYFPGTSWGAFFTEKQLADADIDRIGAMSTGSALVGDYLRINEIPASVLQVNASGDLSVVGASERAQDGTMRIERRALKNKYTFTLAHQFAADALAWRSLVLGRGQHWGFESTLYGSKGTPFTGSGASSSNTHARFGSKCLKVTAGNTAVAAGICKAATRGFGFACWFYFWNGSTFDHYLNVTNAGLTTVWYVNGVVASPSTGWFVMSTSGTLTLGDGSDRYFDDLVVLDLPGGNVPAGWPPALSAKTRAFTDLAQLDLDGRAIEAQQRTVIAQGAVGPASMVGASFGGAWNDTVHVLPVMFDEI